MLLAEIWKISVFLSENFQFLMVKLSVYLNRRVFVMCNVRKPTVGHMCPAKIQISPGIHTVWSESLLGASWIAKDASFFMQIKMTWSDCVDVQADLSLRWTHIRRYVFSCCSSIVCTLYSQPSLYQHSIRQQNSLQWQFECHKHLAQEETIDEKLCKSLALNFKQHMFWIFVRITPLRRF